MVLSNHVKLSRQGEIALYNRVVPKQVIHISEAEAARNFADVLARVRAGAEIVIVGQESGGRNLSLWRCAPPNRSPDGCSPNPSRWPKRMVLR